MDEQAVRAAGVAGVRVGLGVVGLRDGSWSKCQENREGLEKSCFPNYC